MKRIIKKRQDYILLKHVRKTGKILFWFFIGAGLGLFLFLSFSVIIFEKINSGKVYPGIYIDSIDLSGKTENQLRDFFNEKNRKIENTRFAFSSDFGNVEILAKDLNYGYNNDLLTKQAMSLGRGNNNFSNISLILQAYLNGINLNPSYRYSENVLLDALNPIVQKSYTAPTDAVFAFQNGRVTTFKPSKDGKTLDLEDVKKKLNAEFTKVIYANKPQVIVIAVKTKTLQPKITTEKVNNLGIKELLGEGNSFFHHSIPGRIYNITLAAGRLNGVLVAPNEEFSFAKALGDVSAFTGYQQAYVIQNGKTVLGDGGGVCQVSTTLFRALLKAGLKITERHAHAYRVGYYEQDSPPGLDATVYVPNIDLKFQNDTGNSILIQTFIDPETQALTFDLYGTSDSRKVKLTTPIVTNQTPPPPDEYQDDPTLQKGIVKQIDFSAWGANVSFTREVTQNGKVIISDKFISNYRPWKAIYLRGTKES